MNNYGDDKSQGHRDRQLIKEIQTERAGKEIQKKKRLKLLMEKMDNEI